MSSVAASVDHFGRVMIWEQALVRAKQLVSEHHPEVAAAAWPLDVHGILNDGAEASGCVSGEVWKS